MSDGHRPRDTGPIDLSRLKPLDVPAGVPPRGHDNPGRTHYFGDGCNPPHVDAPRDDVAELERLAGAVKAGRCNAARSDTWVVPPDAPCLVTGGEGKGLVASTMAPEVAAYLSKCSPDRILALCARLRAAKDAVIVIRSKFALTVAYSDDMEARAERLAAFLTRAVAHLDFGAQTDDDTAALLVECRAELEGT